MRNVITKTPLRVSLVGGGTDKPEWFLNNRGSVISFAISQYVYVSIRRLPKIYDFRFRVVTSKIQEVREADEIEHPLINAILKSYCKNSDERLELVYSADLPGRSGMGSSSAFAVGTILALSKYFNITKTKKEIAQEAIFFERNILRERGGWQDQIACSFGGANKINFYSDSFEVEEIKNKKFINEIISRSCLVFTRFTRFAHEVEKSKLIKKNHENTYIMLLKQAETLHQLIESEQEVFDQLAKLLNENWAIKKNHSSQVTNKDIDDLYEEVSRYAIGVKLLGAGSGGFFFCLFESKEKLYSFKECYRRTEIIDIDICYEGASILYSNF